MSLTADLMRQALRHLDGLLTQDRCAPVQLIMGGGGAMVLAHGFPLATTDIDAVPKGMELSVLDGYVKRVAADLNFPTDWLNPYFSTYAYTLPADYGQRLVRVYIGDTLRVDALGKEEMLLMKCFAHRSKDVGHARALINGGANVRAVEEQIEALSKKRIPGTQQALDFLDDVLEQLDSS